MKFKIFWHELAPEFKKNLVLVFLCYFFILLSYPLVRSATGALFLEYYQAKNLPFATFAGIVSLCITIYFSNRMQFKWGVHNVFSILSWFSFVFFILGLFAYQSGFNSMSMGLSIWKEIYIVLILHLAIGFLASTFSKEQGKVFYGPLCAVGSIGGIFGGMLTSFLAQNYGTNSVLITGAFFVLVSNYVFQKAVVLKLEKEELNQTLSPLQSIKDIKRFVILLSVIISLTQFMIFISDLKFNFIFEQMISSTDERSVYLGWLNTKINIVSLLIQVLVVPLVMLKFSEKTLHVFTPIFYLFLYLCSSYFLAGSLSSVAGVFIILKACDYSLFTVIKEILYLSYSNVQKYGIKYITDMFVYRTSKALIAFVTIYFQSIFFLDTAYYVFGIFWIVAATGLFRTQKEL